MRLTATICLTLAVLLGSVTVSWGDVKDVDECQKIPSSLPLSQRSGDEIFHEIRRRVSCGTRNGETPSASSAAAKTKETGGKTFEECILDDMPDVGNKMAATVVISECIKKPKAKAGLKSGSWFGPSSPNECMMKYGKKTKVETASKLIFVACRKLYKK